MLTFRQLADSSTPEFRDAMEIYVQSFPSNERVQPDMIKIAVENRRHEMIIGEMDGKVVFIALFYPLKGTDFILFDYMATAPEFRNQGIGTTFVNDLVKRLKKEGRYLLLEVEDPDYGNDKEQRRRRVRFYQRLGSNTLKNVRYLFPPMAGGPPTEMILMILPSPMGNTMEGALVRGLIGRVFCELYRRGPDDPLLNSFINEVPDIVELA